MHKGLVSGWVVVAAAVLAPSAWAADATPVGLWRTWDDKTGEAKSEVRISY